jgi:tagatose 6-phosphate kinase
MPMAASPAGKILCLGATPATQRVMVFRALQLDAVNRAATTLDGAAGKSINVAKVLRALGAHPVATGFLGGDRGDYLLATLQAQGIEQEFVAVAPRTRQCITVIDEAAGTQTELVEESRPVTPEDYARLMVIVQRRLPGCRALVLSGSLTPGGPADFYRQCVQYAHELGVVSIVDAQGAPLIEALKARPGLIKPNRSELAATVNRELKNDADVMNAMRELVAAGAGAMVVTAGKAPTLAFDGRRFWRVATPAIQAVNPIGSGDSFTAGLAWQWAAGENLGEAGRWGAAAGAANALTWMAGEVNRADVEKLAQAVRVESLA